MDVYLEYKKAETQKSIQNHLSKITDAKTALEHLGYYGETNE